VESVLHSCGSIAAIIPDLIDIDFHAKKVTLIILVVIIIELIAILADLTNAFQYHISFRRLINNA
jgi:hypothetical protein